MIRASRGFSLIETMVGAAILLTVGLAVAYLAKSPRFNAANLSNSQDACRAIATEVLTRIKEHGSQSAVVRWAPSSANGYQTYTTANLFEDIKGSSGPLPNRGGRSANPLVGDATYSTPGILNSHLLYLDSMNILTAILDSDGSTCTNEEGVPVANLTGDFGSTVSGSSALVDYEWIRLSPGYPRVAIRPRNLSTSGQPVDCSARARPKSTVVPYREAIPALQNEYRVTQVGSPDEEMPEWGYEVEVWVRYQTRDDAGPETEKICQLSQMFTHKRIAPPTTQLSVITTNTTLDLESGWSNADPVLRSQGSAATNPGNFTMDRTRGLSLIQGRVQSCFEDPDDTTVTARITPRAGSLLYCRDRSRMRYVPSASTIQLPAGTYFANIVNVSPRSTPTGLVSMDQLTYIRHNWAFPGGSLTCNSSPPYRCPGFPPVPFSGTPQNPVSGTPQGNGILTSTGAPDGIIADQWTGATYPRYFYTPTLPYSGTGSGLLREVPPQHADITDYEDVIRSLFGTDHAISQADGSDYGWFPCHQLARSIGARTATTTLNNTGPNGCARDSGPATTIALNYNQSSGQFTFIFENLKRGCEIVVDVVEVDPARSLPTMFNDEVSLRNEFNQRSGRTLTTISEYVAEQSPGNAICYNESAPNSYFFKCGDCDGAPSEAEVPEYYGP